MYGKEKEMYEAIQNQDMYVTSPMYGMGCGKDILKWVGHFPYWSLLQLLFWYPILKSLKIRHQWMKSMGPQPGNEFQILEYMTG